MWTIFTKIFFSYWHSIFTIAPSLLRIHFISSYMRENDNNIGLPHFGCLTQNTCSLIDTSTSVCCLSSYFIKRSTIIASLKSRQSFMDVEGYCIAEENATIIYSVYNNRFSISKLDSIVHNTLKCTSKHSFSWECICYQNILMFFLHFFTLVFFTL